MNVSLIITTFNRPDALSAVLTSVARQVAPPRETIVVDDGSDQRTARVIQQFASNVPRLQHVWQEHRGFRAARLRNLGMARAEGDYVVAIDGDMVLHPHFVADHARYAAPGQYIQAIRIPLTPTATAAYLERPFAIRPWHISGMEKMKYLLRSHVLARALGRRPHCRVANIQGCNQSFWRADIVRVNGYDERLEGCGGEDVDLCTRLASVGVMQRRLRFVALAYHLYHPRTAHWSESRRLTHDTPWATLGLDQHLVRRHDRSTQAA